MVWAAAQRLYLVFQGSFWSESGKGGAGRVIGPEAVTRVDRDAVLANLSLVSVALLL